MQGDQFLTVKTRAGNTRAVLVGMSDVLDKLTELAEIAGDLTPAWDELGRLWESRQKDVFASDGFNSWSGFTAEIVDRGHPLVDEGVMREGMVDATPRYSDEHMVVFGPPKGNPRVSAVATLNTVGHADRGGTRVPARPVVPPLRAAERRRWLEVIDRHLKKVTG